MLSYKTDKSQNKIINEALNKHMEEEIKSNPGYLDLCKYVFACNIKRVLEM